MNLDELKRYAASKKIALGIAEKDYVLSVVLSQLSKSQHAKKFIFKGGTAIKKAYFPEARFSVDLDFNFFGITGEELADEISNLFSKRTILEVNFNEVRSKEITESKVLLRLEYRAQMDHPDNVRLDFTFKEPILTEPQWWIHKDDHDVARRMTCEHLTVRDLNAEGYIDKFYGCKLGKMATGIISSRRACLDCRMEAPRRSSLPHSAFKAMALEEMLSEKIRACLVRGRPRDLYDVWFLQSKGIKMDRQMIIDKLRLYQEFRETIPSIEYVREQLRAIEPEWDRDLKVLIPAREYPTFQEALESVIKGLEKSGWS